MFAYSVNHGYSARLKAAKAGDCVDSDEGEEDGAANEGADVRNSAIITFQMRANILLVGLQGRSITVSGRGNVSLRTRREPGRGGCHPRTACWRTWWGGLCRTV